jgi:phenylpyruvate tautomerase PptA (4-oxalocrotonate tautomerase family)
MPLYTVYHPTSLVAHSRSQIATVITDSHVAATGAPGFLVKVVFIPLEWSSFFAGGHAKDKLLRIVGVIRAGRSKEERQKLLLSIYEGIKRIEKNDVNRYEVEIHLEEMKTEVLNCPGPRRGSNCRISSLMGSFFLNRGVRKRRDGKMLGNLFDNDEMIVQSRFRN